MISIGKKQNSLYYKYVRTIANSAISRKVNTISQTTGEIWHRKHQHADIGTMLSPLYRSLPALHHSPIQCHRFHTNNILCQKEKDDANKSNEQPKKKVEDKKNENEKKDDKDNEEKVADETAEKVASLFTKCVLWAGLTYTLFLIGQSFRSFLYPNQKVEDTERSLFVSWQEFVYEMLSAGEVREIVVRTEPNVVTIVLHDGAIIKGRRAHSRRYHILVDDCLKFEEKLRDVEKRLGIKESKYILSFNLIRISIYLIAI